MQVHGKNFIAAEKHKITTENIYVTGTKTKMLLLETCIKDPDPKKILMYCKTFQNLFLF